MTQGEIKINIKRQNNGYILKKKFTGDKSIAYKSSDKNQNNHLTYDTSGSQE